MIRFCCSVTVDKNTLISVEEMVWKFENSLIKNYLKNQFRSYFQHSTVKMQNVERKTKYFKKEGTISLVWRLVVRTTEFRLETKKHFEPQSIIYVNKHSFVVVYFLSNFTYKEKIWRKKEMATKN